MRAPRRPACALGLIAALAALAVLAQPAPPPAEANPVCDVGSGPAEAVTGGIGAITGGAIGGGNPVGDACNEVSDGAVGAATSPIEGAVEGLGNTIFAQVTAWASDGAAWLIEEVVAVIDETTTPKLTTRGFLATYGQMAVIGALLAAAMLLAAVLEGMARGDLAMLGRVVLVNLPLAFIATSVAYAIVQLALVGTDGLCHAIGDASQHQSRHFFRGAVASLGEAGGSAGETLGAAGPGGPAGGRAAGETAVPLFVAFLAAVIGGFAAFFVWIELLMRDAAVYVVSLFMPLALAASIWPRWSGAMRRTAELLVVVIGSKFVIVSIIALAAGLLAGGEGGVEHVLAAAALMLLACFSPFALFRLVPFAEGAIGAAYGRRHAGTSSAGAARSVASSAQVMRRTATSSWGRGVGGMGGGGQASRGGGGAAAGLRGVGGAQAAGARGAAGAGAAGKAGGAAAAGAAGGAVGAAGSLPIAAAGGARAGAERLAQSGAVDAAMREGGGGAASPPPGEGSGRGKEPGSSPKGIQAKAPRPASEPRPNSGGEAATPPPRGQDGPPRPSPESAKPPRRREGESR